MPTSLGGSAHTGVRVHVKNGLTTTLTKGTVVTWFSVLANNPAVGFLDLANGKVDYVAGGGAAPDADQLIPYITVKASLADGAVPGVTAALGVTTSDIEGGDFGEIQTYGICQVQAGAVVAAGLVLNFAVDGQYEAALAANEDNPFGISLEASTAAGELHWCWVNFIGAAMGASAAGAHGKAY